jgi:hypothetical protein
MSKAIKIAYRIRRGIIDIGEELVLLPISWVTVEAIRLPPRMNQWMLG